MLGFDDRILDIVVLAKGDRTFLVVKIDRHFRIHIT